ncbi:PhzF family phenazine biosynthesis protein [Actinokineospora diospyrosa]|uniref:Phenazine biosynthesis protein PhzF family n=1 Tax=Actinokineospora diospyrosa TaxID=103728 RepID=A0ABT1IHG7_9PSEU|nr:PhzF family phenazine biosynthesis isomerase [Actinokineospora diospyrosa]MCP2272067.1 phenazine biosynthesis protein PhzF family [Actinokineospora diospyrosa]
MDVYVVDAFTDQAFRGNPAAVVLLTEDRSAEWMQSVAAEMNLSETAFADLRCTDPTHPIPAPLDPTHPIPLRWFTPKAEVDLCGHATLATAHVLEGARRFSTRSGVLTATPTDTGIELDFPADPLQPVEPPAALVAALPGVTVLSAHRGREDFLIRVASADEVRALRPDLSAFAQDSSRGVIVTAPGDQGADFVSRCFYPAVGIDEDPVTGSAHCTLAGFWGHELDRSLLVGKQLSARGGTVTVQLDGDRVRLTGRAVTVLSGRLTC